jgi:hypothetical protein
VSGEAPEQQSEAAAPRPPARARRVLPSALVWLGAVLAFLAIFAIWANRQALDTDNWTETSSELLADEAVRTQLSAFLVDQLYENVDVQGELEEVLPPRAQVLAGPAAGGLKELAQRGAFELLGRPVPQQLWEAANRRAHERLLDVLEDRGEIVSTADGAVALDLRALLGATADRVGVGGRAQAALPEGAAQITIVESDELELAQDLVRLLRTLAWLLVALALICFALALALGRGRRRELLRASGIAFVAAGVGALLARSVAGGTVVDALAATEAVRPAAEAAWRISTSLLREAAAATIAYGVVIVLAAWVAGPTPWATGLRRALAPWLREPAWAYGGLALLVVLLLAWGPTPALRQPLPALILILLLAGGLEALRRQTAREHPGADRDQAIARLRERVASAGHRVAAAVPARPARGGTAAVEGGEARIAALERLARLRDAGVIDDAELAREKRRLLE